LGLIHAQRPTPHLEAVRLLDGVLCFSGSHVNERESAGPPGLTIVDEFDGFNFAVAFEYRAHFVFCCGEWQVANVDRRHQIFGMETLALRPGRKCRSLQWLLGKDKIAACRVSQLCGGILSRYGFKAAHLKLVRATASRLQTGMVSRVSGHTLSTVRGIERRIWESPSFMAWEDVNQLVSLTVVGKRPNGRLYALR
jgi:hypothetical protein